MTQREQFEKWANAAKLDTARCCKDAWGKATYLPHIESMWFGWKAAQAQAAESTMQEVATDGALIEQAAMKLALDALQLSRDDVEFCLAENLQLAGYERYDKRIAFYKEQLIKHDAAIAALEGVL